MGKGKKIKLIVFLAVVVLAVLLVGRANSVVKEKVENYLSSSLPETVKLKYSNLDLDLWKGAATLEGIELEKVHEISKAPLMKVCLDSLSINDIGYWAYLFNDNIDIGNIQLVRPQLTYFKLQNPDSVKEVQEEPKVFNYRLNLGRLDISKAGIEIVNTETDSILLHVSDLDFGLDKVFVDETVLRQKIPVDYEGYQMAFDSLFYTIGPFENMAVGPSKLSHQDMAFENVRIFSKYSKYELSKHIPVERDFADVVFESVTLKDYKLSVGDSGRVSFSSPKMEILNPQVDFFRDKLVADDPKIKPLYNEMLRDLDFDLTIDSLQIKNASVAYSERVKRDNHGGKITFSNLNADIANVSNTYEAPIKTEIEVEANFMEHAPLKVHWNFDVNDPDGTFIFQAELDKLKVHDVNKFSEPNLRIKFEGEIEQLYFTIWGNTNVSQVDMRAKYEDFQIIALKKDGSTPNKLLSGLLNTLVAKDSDRLPDHFREGHKEGIERNKTKSVFNYVWINAKDGLLKTMVNHKRKHKT
ncbi:DUF748 domain-containing protein [Mangrovimonas sp. DI 80]|uniref:DUF748 domain-containing protein n=1 Tax=Mangrovimonas sp. DI 80 TaxID=1779330 RepID=UPI00097830C9|nr:DUF748 domain-containing protein [Mangrovimonas sp. DI 80]OMP29850.1 hypothetical protein BKM32_14650 [Mangrovimonas sp. DI 80]